MEKIKTEMAVLKKQSEYGDLQKKQLQDTYDFRRFDVTFINDTKMFLKKGQQKNKKSTGAI